MRVEMLQLRISPVADTADLIPEFLPLNFPFLTRREGSFEEHGPVLPYHLQVHLLHPHQSSHSLQSPCFSFTNLPAFHSSVGCVLPLVLFSLS